MNKDVAMILAGTHPHWRLDLVLLNNEGVYWAKIRARVGHAFSSGESQTPLAAICVAFSSVDLGIQAS
jgi:hypothetical protein